jgi:hypothetical protein
MPSDAISCTREGFIVRYPLRYAVGFVHTSITNVGPISYIHGATVCAYRGRRICPTTQAVALSNIHTLCTHTYAAAHTREGWGMVCHFMRDLDHICGLCDYYQAHKGVYM